MPSLITTLGGTIAAVCSRCRSQRNLRIRHGQAAGTILDAVLDLKTKPFDWLEQMLQLFFFGPLYHLHPFAYVTHFIALISDQIWTNAALNDG